MKLFEYPASSSSFRVRIALQLKGIAYESFCVDLAKDGGEHRQPAFLSINPQALVPVIESDGRHIAQSLAILEFLEERYPSPALMPGSSHERAQVRSLALHIACEMHPLSSMKTRARLSSEFSLDDNQTRQWALRYLEQGFGQFEAVLGKGRQAGPFCHGHLPTIADCFLIPQVYNARKMGLDMRHFPRIDHIYSACLELDAFQRAMTPIKS
ncbi:maleylacetoacetate isomerase [Cupriavidus sp. CuC1]|uniref:maleylacetoacetate isomerase n=1 Tax=Cupriavidus sp. CuC1 TaxID=3373131 RepID=UPI0037D35A3A